MFVASVFVKQNHVQQRNLEAENVGNLEAGIKSCSACFHMNFLSFHRRNCDGVAKDNSNQVFASSNL